MAWDFSTEPEFQAQLDWMRDVRARRDLADRDGLRGARPRRLRARDRAAEGARARARAVGGAPAARAGRAGLRPGQARADARDPRHEPVRAGRVRQPGARLRQLRDPRAGRDRRPEGAVAAPAAGGRPALGVLDDRARQRGQRPDAAADARGRGRRRLGDQRPQVVLDQRLGRRLPDRDGGHRPGSAPHQRASMFIVPGRHAGRARSCATCRRWSTRPSASAPTAGTPRSSTRTCACRRTRCSARAAPAS